MNEFKEITLVCDDSFDGIMTAVYDGRQLVLHRQFSRRYRLKHMNMFSGQHIIMIRIAGMLFWNSLKWDLEQVVELLRCLVKIE